MKYRILLFCISLATLISSCHKEDTPEVKNERTVLMYMVGNNSLAKFISSDLEEMRQGVSELNTGSSTLLVFYKDRSVSRLIRFVNNDGQVEEEEIATYENKNSLDIPVMKEIMATAFGKYPADSYGLAFWSHGDGWVPSNSLRWWGQDGNSFMNISDLHTVLKTVPHLDFLFFDACFMQSIEVAYDLRDCADYQVGSPTEIPGPGAPYQMVVPAMFTQANTAINIAEAYFRYYESLYDEGRNISNYNWTGGASIGVLKLSETERLAAATAKVLPKYIQNGAAIDVAGIMQYDQRSYRYYYDLDRLIYKLTGGNNDYAEWRTAFDAAVLYWESTPENYSAYVGMFTIDKETGGLSTYLPRASNPSLNSSYQGLEWYKAAGWSQTGW